MPVVRSKSYEGPALEWMFGQVICLRRALSDAGVSDETTQRAICEAFFFDLAGGFDDSAVSAEPHRRHRLAFEDGDLLLLPDDDTFAFHECAHGVVGEAFGDA